MFSLNKIDGFDYIDLNSNIIPNSIDAVFIDNVAEVSKNEQDIIKILDKILVYKGVAIIEDVFWPTLLDEYEIKMPEISELTKTRHIYDVQALIKSIKNSSSFNILRFIIQNNKFRIEIERV